MNRRTLCKAALALAITSMLPAVDLAKATTAINNEEFDKLVTKFIKHHAKHNPNVSKLHGQEIRFAKHLDRPVKIEVVGNILRAGVVIDNKENADGSTETIHKMYAQKYRPYKEGDFLIN